MPNYVPGIGPSNAKLALVGEAPGADEDRLLIPFSGKSGKLVDECLDYAGVPRSSVYLTNVCKVRPPNNDLNLLHMVGHRLEDFLPQLEAEISALQPNCILAIGATALRALVGIDGIKHYRGSILQTRSGIKVVPTLHPAGLLHSEGEDSGLTWKDLTYIKWDFARAVEESKFREYDIPRRNLIVCRSSIDLYRFLDKYSTHDLVSVDIETFRTIPICIALAFNSDEAISIPLANIHGGFVPQSDLINLWKEVADILANPRIRKIGQNFKFDEKQLTDCLNGTLFFGLRTRSFFFDTLLAFRTLYPELPGKLEFITSVLTKEPYYKEEGKGFNPKKDKFDRLLLYNAKDAAVTFECYERELEELRERNLDDFFFSRVMPLHPFYSRVESRGVRRDNFQQKYLLEKYKDKLKELQEELNSLCEPFIGAERKINANSNGASGDVPWLVFVVLGFPKRQSTDEKTLDALMRNHAKDGTKKRILELILELRKVRKVIGTYVEAEVDYRGRLLTSFRIALETGRTSTSILKSPVTTEPMGAAFQTLTKHGEVGSDIKSMYLPDDGCCILEPDLSGAEARVVAVLARDEKLKKIFKYNLDVHRITYGWIDSCCPDDLLALFFAETNEDKIQELKKEINKILKQRIDDETRQIGKKFRHAGHYDMGKRTASEQTGLSEWRCGKILEKFHASNPNIRGVYHEGTRDILEHNDRTLVNPFGRVRQFLDRWGHELFKEAYAQIPQSTVSDQTKFAAIRVEKRCPFIKIFSESHDSFAAHTPIDKVDEVILVMKEELETPIDFSKCSMGGNELLVIPAEITMYEKNWEVGRKIA